jgi:hypothetical protein
MRQYNKSFLINLAMKMQINREHFKTKVTLIAALKPLFYKRHIVCYNQMDPCTLSPLYSIPSEFYTQWSQHSYIFGADIRSIHKLFQYQQFILPFALDLRHDYNEHLTFDMRESFELVKQINEFEPEIENNEIMPPSVTQFMFQVESLCGSHFGYINGVINKKIINERNVSMIKRSVLKSMREVSRQLLFESSFIHEIFLQTCLIPFVHFRTTNKERILEFILGCLSTLVEVLGDGACNIVFTIFNDL